MTQDMMNLRSIVEKRCACDTLRLRCLTSFTASILYSRQNYRRCIRVLWFHAQRLNSVS